MQFSLMSRMHRVIPIVLLLSTALFQKEFDPLQMQLQHCRQHRQVPAIFRYLVTEYGSLGIDDFNGTVGNNSGIPIWLRWMSRQQMLQELFPDAKNVGLLYCTGQRLTPSIR